MNLLKSIVPALVGLFVSNSQAASVIANGDFESGPTPYPTTGYKVADSWTIVGDSGREATGFTSNSNDGSYRGFMPGGGTDSLSQVTTWTIALGDEFTLDFWVNCGGTGRSVVGTMFWTNDGGTTKNLFTGTGSGFTGLADNNTATWQEANAAATAYTVAAGNPAVGAQLGVTFKGVGGYVGVDSISLNAVAVPEPSSLLLLGFAGLALTGRRRR